MWKEPPSPASAKSFLELRFIAWSQAAFRVFDGHQLTPALKSPNSSRIEAMTIELLSRDQVDEKSLPEPQGLPFAPLLHVNGRSYQNSISPQNAAEWETLPRHVIDPAGVGRRRWPIVIKRARLLPSTVVTATSTAGMEKRRVRPWLSAAVLKTPQYI